MIDEITEPEVYNWYNRNGIKFIDQNQLKADIIEDFIGNDIEVFDLSMKYQLKLQFILDTINLYYIKPIHGLSIMSSL